jgi:molybdate-binding protein/DNA-binding XRE family transcriptional regulator
MSSAKDHDTTRPQQVRSNLAEARQQRGIPAAELAKRAGVSRQTIYAMEAGDYIPNTSVALRLARILEVSVEDLFQLEAEEPEPPKTVRAELIGAHDLFAGSPVELCRVDERMVGVPAVPAPWQLLPADGVLVNPKRSTVQLLREEEREARLLIAGCDPAAPVLARRLQRAGVCLVSASVNSSVALDLLNKRMAHVAGTHLTDERRAERHPTGASRDASKSGSAVFAFALWEEGFVVARGNPKGIHGIEDLARRGVRLVNREKGSGSRQLLDRKLEAAGIPKESVRGYEDESPGHLPAAWRVYAGAADCCIATRSAARPFGLDFLPLTSERYDLVIRNEHLELAAMERLLETLTQAAFRRELEALCGYDTRETGRRIA